MENQDIASITDYPIHNPDDESSGMDLVKKIRDKRKPRDPGDYDFFSFKDWLKKANTFQGKKYFKFDKDGIQED